MSANVVVETRDRVTRIEIARIDKKNALTLEMYGAIGKAMSAAEADPQADVDARPALGLEAIADLIELDQHGTRRGQRVARVVRVVERRAQRTERGEPAAPHLDRIARRLGRPTSGAQRSPSPPGLRPPERRGCRRRAAGPGRSPRSDSA